MNSNLLKTPQSYIELESWQVEEIKQAVQEAEAGEFADDQEVQEVLGRWSNFFQKPR